MKALFCELDGTTFLLDFPDPLKPPPRWDSPILPRLTPPWEEVRITSKPVFKTARYELKLVSKGIAFYDRVVDAEELAWD